MKRYIKTKGGLSKDEGNTPNSPQAGPRRQMKHPDKNIMEKAITLARKKKAVACIIVKGNSIIAEATTTT